MRIALGADHAGVRAEGAPRRDAARRARASTYDDFGTDSDESVDYPPICADGRRARSPSGEADRGIVRLRQRAGHEQIAANKVPGIRAALCNDSYTARLSPRAQRRQRARAWAAASSPSGSPTKSSTLWLDTPFAGGRHQRRIDKIADTRTRILDSHMHRDPVPLAHARRDRSGDRRRDRARAAPPERRASSSSPRRTSSARPCSRRPARC